MATQQLILVLQTSVAPCVIISGVGLLVLSMTNRFGRPIDRIRLLAVELEKTPENEREPIKEQIKLLYRRAMLLQRAIIFSVFSIFLVATVILSLFLDSLLGLGLEMAIELLFAGSVVCVVVGLVFFLMDIGLTLDSVKIEIKRHGIDVKQ
ncbi:MAG: DUF2721 domain-containing protein [Candidatus Bathyarchaeota archaeon]|nr:DUF2721 domain-containing protein [Candidatus Bathyarchaeota archaeon]